MFRNAGLSKLHPTPRHYGKHAVQLFFTSASPSAQLEPNSPIQLDPSLQKALQDDFPSGAKIKSSRVHTQYSTPHKELMLVSREAPKQSIEDKEGFETTDSPFPRSERKSPAASYGSRQIGTVILPYEMQKSIISLIAESEKPLVHVDADRLFNPGSSKDRPDGKIPSSWSLHYTPPQYTEAHSLSKMSHIRARLNKIRDGTAFASVVMPAQYAVIRAVLEQTKSRLGNEWGQKINRFIEWGSGTGAGIWAAHHTFQKKGEPPFMNILSMDTGEDTYRTQEDLDKEELKDNLNLDQAIPRNLQLQWSNLESYIAIEERDGLSNIARKLLKDVPTASHVSIQRELTTEQPSPRMIHDKKTVAISAFLLNTIQTTGSKKAILREMWNSGADLMIIIEDASISGFQNVTDARDFLLRLANKQLEDKQHATGDADSNSSDVLLKQGAHVVAPCPHDKPCPLAFHQKISASKRAFETLSFTRMDRCTFMQRLQRPSFVRLTKHVKRGEEDVGYSYVVIQRGERSRLPFAMGRLHGREGAVARWAEEARMAKEEEGPWVIYENDMDRVSTVLNDGEITQDVEAVALERLNREDLSPTSFPPDKKDPCSTSSFSESDNLSMNENLETTLREESYSWPRINFTPLKRNGHVIIDACTPEGMIMRMTYPRSQGKQIYYDARKSSWGDIFPHAPKHQPIPRFTGRPGKAVKALLKKSMEEQELTRHMLRADKADDSANTTRAGWSTVIDRLKEERKRVQKERRKAKDEKEFGFGFE